MHHLCSAAFFTVLIMNEIHFQIKNDHSPGQESCPGEGKGDQDS